MASDTGPEFDVAITATANGKVVRFPSVVTRALEQRGYNRVKMTIDDEGIHLRPYVGVAGANTAGARIADLPEWAD